MSSPAGHLVDGRSERQSVVAPTGDKTVPHGRGAREAVRKRTFTRWINSRLTRRDPTLQVDDLFTDVQDGKILMALIEELSGCKMWNGVGSNAEEHCHLVLDRFRPSTHHIFTLSNVSKVLEFLEDRNVRVMNIDAADVADGRPSVVLALIWNIIVFFQLKEVTGNLERCFSSSMSSLVSLTDSSDSARSSPAPPSDDHCSTLPSKKKRTSRRPKYYRSRSISTLLSWTQTCTAPFGVEVHDFGKSWRNGLAFLALVKCARPELVDMRAALTSSPRQNLTQAFREAQQHLDVPPLLDPEDVMMHSPDEQSIITYVAQFPQHFPQNRDVNVSTLSLDEYNPSGVYDGSTSLSGSSLGFVEPDQFEIASSCSSAAVFNGGSAAGDESSFSNGGFLHSSSIEGSSWSSSVQKESQSVGMEEDDGGLSPSEEGLHILPELDSEEEDAYDYILELDHEEHGLQDELKCRPAIKAHPSSTDFHQVDGEADHVGSFLEMRKQSYQPSSEGYRGACEEHPELCTWNGKFHDSKVHRLPNTDRNEVWNESVGAESLDLISCSSKEGGLHSIISSDSVDIESLYPVKSLEENVLTKEDKLSEMSSLEDDYPPDFRAEELETTSETAKDVSLTALEDVMLSETEDLHMVLLLWVLLYCIFMLHQTEIWELF